MNLKKKLMLAATAALLAFGAVALTACGGESDEEAIEKALVADLDQVKSIDDAFLDEAISSDDLSYLADYGIDGKEFVKSYLEGFDYSIDGIEVDGDTALATVTLTCKSMDDYSEALSQAVEEMTSDVSRFADMSEDEVNQEIGSVIMSALSGLQAKPLDPITIEYEKANGQWAPTKDAEDVVASAMFSGM